MKFTCCPVCETVFRVSSEQLEARQGRVRCGQCAQVFNAFDNLADSPDLLHWESDLPAPEPEHLAPGTPLPAVLISNRRPQAAEPARNLVAEQADEDDWDLPLELTLRSEPRISEEKEVPHPAPEPMEPIVTDWVSPEDAPYTGIPRAEPESRRTGWLWGTGVIVLLLGTLLQGVWVFRTELTMAAPSLRPQFLEWCRNLGCSVPLPKKADLIGIEGSELKPSPQGKGLLQLSATLRNRAPFSQAYPALEVTLTDTDDKPLARRVFNPAEILPAKTDIAAGFPAGSDLSLSLTLDPTTLTAAGYRIYVFYP